MFLMLVLLHTVLKPAKRPSTFKRRNTGIGAGALIATSIIAKIVARSSARSINVPDSNGETYLIWAARTNYPKVMRFWLWCGADVDAQDRDGNTALFLASQHRSGDAVRVLLKNNANVHIQNSCGETPLFRANLYRNRFSRCDLTDVMKLLLESEADDSTDVIKLLLESKADVHIKDNKDMTIFQRLLSNSDRCSMREGRWFLLSGVGYALVSNGAGTDEDFAKLLPILEEVWRLWPYPLPAEMVFYPKWKWDSSSKSAFNQKIEQGILQKRQICVEQIRSGVSAILPNPPDLPDVISELIAEFLVSTSLRNAMLESIEMLQSD